MDWLCKRKAGTRFIARPHRRVLVSVSGCASVSERMGKPFLILSSTGGKREGTQCTPECTLQITPYHRMSSQAYTSIFFYQFLGFHCKRGTNTVFHKPAFVPKFCKLTKNKGTSLYVLISGKGWRWPGAVQGVCVCVGGRELSSVCVCVVPVCLSCSRQPLMNAEALSGGHKSQDRLLLP